MNSLFAPSWSMSGAIDVSGNGSTRGNAVDPPILWSIAHRQDIPLPAKDYWGIFEAIVTMKPAGNLNLWKIWRRLQQHRALTGHSLSLLPLPTNAISHPN